MGRKLVRENEFTTIRWTSVLSADRMRPLRFRNVTTAVGYERALAQICAE
jgi:hypothetical protein